MRSTLLRLLWPKLARAITKLKIQIPKDMSFDTDQEVAIIEAATTALGTLQSVKDSLTAALAALAPLQADDDALKATVQKLTDDDARVDDAIAKLQAATPAPDAPPAPAPETPAA